MDGKFSIIADGLMNRIKDIVDCVDCNNVLGVDERDGVLEIYGSDKVIVISRYMPSEQIWIASPFSGSVKFSLCDDVWRSRDGQELFAFTEQELGFIIARAMN